MRLPLLSIVFVWALAWPVAARSSVEGRWIGGIQGGHGVVAVDVRVSVTSAGLSATMDIPEQGATGLPLRDIEVRGDRVRFGLPSGRGALWFEGRLDERGRLAGSVRLGPGSHAPFELLKLATPTTDDLRGVFGTYTWGDGNVLLIAPSGAGAVYVDYSTGRTGDLFAVGRDLFVGGATVATGYPIAIELDLVRGLDDDVMTATMRRGKEAVTVRRERFYRQEELTFTSGDVTIAGTLLLPTGPGPHPALVMSHGSGDVTRDALRRSADHFARHGIAVLITDKRGSGRSTGSWRHATFDDLASDALAGVHVLRARRDIQQAAIGLHGASQGGWVAPLAASRSRDVAFVIVESAPTITPLQHERLRVESQLRADGFGQKEIAQALAFMDLKFEVARSGTGWPRLEAAVREGTDTAWLAYTNPPASLAALRWDWDHIFEFDPMPVLSRLEVPVLALYGGRDTIVPARVHQARMAGALGEGRRINVTVDVIEHANHGFLEAVTGGRREAAQLTSFVDGYFDRRTAWVLDAARSAAAGATVAANDARR